MVVFNFQRPSYIEDPYPALAHLRREEPVHWSPDLQAWVLTRYADCLALTQDQDTFSVDPTVGQAGPRIAAHRAVAPLGNVHVMATVDDPDHERLRRGVMRAFAPRAVGKARVRIAEALAALVAPVDPGRPFDVSRGLAEPLVVATAIGHLGIPPERWGQFYAWGGAVTLARTDPTVSPAQLAAAVDALAGLRQLFATASTDEDTVFGSARDAVSRGEMSADEAIMLLVHASLSGNGPTTLAVSNFVRVLAGHPEQYRWLRANPGAAGPAVEELLRFDSPTQAIARWARVNTTLGGRRIRKGQMVWAMVGAANRDPDEFHDPDGLDFERSTPRHLSFSHGPHFCLGAPLARLELQLALGAVVERWPSLRVVSFEWLRSFLLRGPQALVVQAG